MTKDTYTQELAKWAGRALGLVAMVAVIGWTLGGLV